MSRILFSLGGPAFLLGSVGAWGQIEEVIVTARKSEENLQDVPVAISAFTGTQMERSGVVEFFDLQYITPNLILQDHVSATSATSVVIRGQSQPDVLLTTDSSVGVYVDGVNLPRSLGFKSNNFDIERVEVLKGPQGTLYGRNTTGGAINVITRKASHDGIGGFAQASVGNYNRRDLAGGINVPLIRDTLAMRVSVQRTQRDGYGKSTVTGRELVDDDEYFARASFRFDPSETVSLIVSGDWQKVRESGNILRSVTWGGGPTHPDYGLRSATVNSVFIATGVELGEALGPGAIMPGYLALVDQVGGSFYRNNENAITGNVFNAWGAGATLSVGFDSFDFKSITGYRESDRLGMADLDNSRFSLLHPNQGSSNEFFSQEFQVNTRLLEDRLRALVGAYYSREEGLEGDGGLLVALASINPTIARTNGEIENASWAIFSENTYSISSRMGFTFGLRYTEEKKELVSRNNTTLGLNGPIISCNVPGGTPANCRAAFSDTFDGWSWLLSLNYAVSDDSMVYGRVARGFRGGGQNARGTASLISFQEFSPEYAREVEVGLKSDLFDRRLRLNFAAFWTDYADIQRSVIVPAEGSTLSTVLTNAAAATILGFELEATAHMADRWTFSGSVGYTHASYDEFDDISPHTGLPIDRSDEPFGLPEWQLNLSARYERPLDADRKTLGFQANWYWQSDIDTVFTTTDPTFDKSDIRIDSYGLLNLRANLTFEEHGVDVSVFVNNALDKEYVGGHLDLTQFGTFIHVSGFPRMIGMQLRKDF